MTEMLALRVGSYNIYNTTCRYEEGRRNLLVETLRKLGAQLDIIGLQEVVFGDHGQTEMFTSVSNWEKMLEAPLTEPIVVGVADPTFRIDGNAFLIQQRKWSIVEGSHEILELSPNRNVHRIRLQSRGIEVVVANTHLHWAVDTLAQGICLESDAQIRGDQMQAALHWLEEVSHFPTILVGDLNVFFPDEQIHELLISAGFESSYAKIHGTNCKTCPTPLQAPSIDPAASVDQIADFVLVRQPALEGTHSGTQLVVTSASLAGDEFSVQDSTLYPSDHYAVLATIEFRGL